jgi:hypothetical protein
MDFTPICSRCAKNMDLVVVIKSLGCQPGLNAYECPFCGHTHSPPHRNPRTRHRPEADESGEPCGSDR